MTKPPLDVAASVRQRLLDLARKRGEGFQGVLTRYGIERLLYRLSRSPHADEFVLKGAMLFAVWTGEMHRATWDVDLLGRGEPEPGRIARLFAGVCRVPVVEDGLVFDAGSVRAERIREDLPYQGLRVRLAGRLGAARIQLQIDVGFGDAVRPPPRKLPLPTLLDLPAPALKSYPREAVVAEKLNAMVTLGMANSRMKDFYDLWVLAMGFPFDGRATADAVRATFKRRRTPLPADEPLALTDVFAGDSTKQVQWKAFVRRGRLRPDDPGLPAVIDALRGFLLPPIRTLAAGDAFDAAWAPGGPWRSLDGPDAPD
ncbi:MAG: nucleotidyl transferase AbiEii/AbiGii toxin family protein [Deltaproteobacteria bacterium]|nr:nucleotidyl transferase AbiEii/AbiGii toxin family protein [Deltaproteobacteria bacterium]